MIENSSAGLVMLGAEVAVTVTREEHHQSVLSGYLVTAGQQRRVAVELGWCTISSGKHRGEPAIEVRLDGQRVGELTNLMSQRYAPVVAQVAVHGGRPGCEAVIQRGTKGLEVVLRLPRDTDGIMPTPLPTHTTQASFPAQAMTPAPPVPLPPAPPRHRGLFSSHRPAWIAAAVIAVAFFGAVINANDDSPPSVSTANGVATTTAATATTTPPPATTTQPTMTSTTTTTTIAPTPAPKPQAPPPPAPKTTTPKQAAPAPPTPEAQPEPQPACDHNYSGCVPVASDVDCLGGTGNGPAYVAGPIKVTGTDIYDLDRDGNGIACE